MPTAWRKKLHYLWLCVLALFQPPIRCPAEAAALPSSVTAEHPCSLCNCPGGPDLLPPDEHRPDCEWAGVMCLPCRGLGRCAGCGGTGVRASPAASEFRPRAEMAQRLATELRRLIPVEERCWEFFHSDRPGIAAALLDDYTNLGEQLQRALAKIARLETALGRLQQGDLES